ncbi:hypothetical protein [Alteribacter populi]|uniref:hypothetical protein n=1 Tax=Alteribacter populi TaxID=2011011 RepID=UPI000BBAA354|nr:hypothetical protein [Alteribacter populi]
MAESLTTQAADEYIGSYVIDTEDWFEAEEAKKQRMINVADRTLRKEFPLHHVPADAVFEYCAKLAVVFNDTNRLQQHGVASFSVTGVASFTFKENNVKAASGQALTAYIPPEVYGLINASPENVGLPKLGDGSTPRDVTM